MKVEPVVAPPPGNPRFPLFDSLRAIAVLSVLVTHTALLSGANAFAWYGKYTARLDVGVTVFFLISGFLLYRPFVAAWLDGHAVPRLGDYARRRVLRIIPAYWLALTVLAIYPGLQQMWTGHSWAYYLFAQDYKREWTIGGLGPAWSLSIEAAFYVTLPFFAMAMRRLGRGFDRAGRVRLEVAMVAALGVLATVVRAATPDSQLHVTLIGTFDWFALGMLLAIASAALAGREPRPVALLRRWPSLPWIVALALFWYVSTQLGLTGAAFVRITPAQSIGMHLLYAAIAFLFLLPAVFADDGPGLPRRLLRTRLLSWLGVISYGIFLWHHPIAGKLTEVNHHNLFHSARMLGITSATFAIALACASISYYLLERPILRYKNRPLLRRNRIEGVEDVGAGKRGARSRGIPRRAARDA